MLPIGQCTQALKDKLKEDANWESIADSYDSIGLLGLIEKYVLNSLPAIGAHERQVFEKLLWGLVSSTIFVRC